MKDPSIRKPKKVSRFIPKFDTEPERIFRNEIVAKTFPEEKYVTSEPFKTRFRVYPIYPDIKFINVPVVVEVKGVHWHRSKRQVAKDEAKVNCYLGEGFYCYECSDLDLKKSLERVRWDFQKFVEEARREKFNEPKHREFKA